MLLPNYTTKEDLKDKMTSLSCKKRSNTSISQLKKEEEESSKISFSSFHPISLTNLQVSTNSCVNIKGAEVDVFVSSSSYDTLFHKKLDQEMFKDYVQPMILSSSDEYIDSRQFNDEYTDAVTSNPSMYQQHSALRVSPSFLHTSELSNVQKKFGFHVRNNLCQYVFSKYI